MRGVRVTATEGRGFEPLRACAQRFSRPPPYHLGLALPTANTELTRQRPGGKPVFVPQLCRCPSVGKEGECTAAPSSSCGAPYRPACSTYSEAMNPEAR